IGQTHWEDPRQGFLAALGDTFAVTGKVWRRAGSHAIAIRDMYPSRHQPEPSYRFWPWHWEWSVLLGCGLLALLYAGAITVWAKRWGPGERVEPWRVASFAASLAVVVGSLNGPLHDLSDLYLFSTHMVQHLMLAQIFPLLFLIGIPPGLSRRLLRSRPVARAWALVAGV